MVRLVSALLGLALAVGVSACFVEDENAVAAPDHVSGEAPALSVDEVAAAEPCSAMLATMVVASDPPVGVGANLRPDRSCESCHVDELITSLAPSRKLPGPFGRRP